jgi:hypothetical protein
MSESERKQVRDIIVADMFNASRLVQEHLSEAAKLIFVADFLFAWYSLLTNVVNRLTRARDLSTISEGSLERTTTVEVTSWLLATWGSRIVFLF